jgi:mannose-1-phosphate guanylyltransferase
LLKDSSWRHLRRRPVHRIEHTIEQIRGGVVSKERVFDGVDGFWAVIPAGGAGTRLWPLSRAASPKFLQDLTGTGRTMLQETADRLAPLCGTRLMVATGVAHAPAVRTQLPQLAAENLLAEPSPRDSMPAIGLAAAILERRDPEAILGSFAADHVIADEEAFRSCVREAICVAREDLLVTIGIKPVAPATGFGYIRQGNPLAIDGAPRAHGVSAFVEKPGLATAQQYVDSGKYRWNAGMFVVKAVALLDLLTEFQPELARRLRHIAAEPALREQQWSDLTRIAIDHAVAEPAAAAGRVAVIPGDFGWGDVGDFSSLASVLAERTDMPGTSVLGDAALVWMKDATGVIAPRSGRAIVALGIQDVVVIDTPDALLVTTKARAQDVKSIVDDLKSAGREDLI